MKVCEDDVEGFKSNMSLGNILLYTFSLTYSFFCYLNYLKSSVRLHSLLWTLFTLNGSINTLGLFNIFGGGGANWENRKLLVPMLCSVVCWMLVGYIAWKKLD